MANLLSYTGHAGFFSLLTVIHSGSPSLPNLFVSFNASPPYETAIVSLSPHQQRQGSLDFWRSLLRSTLVPTVGPDFPQCALLSIDVVVHTLTLSDEIPVDVDWHKH
jgi:hypothetical protein